METKDNKEVCIKLSEKRFFSEPQTFFLNDRFLTFEIWYEYYAYKNFEIKILDKRYLILCKFLILPLNGVMYIIDDKQWLVKIDQDFVDFMIFIFSTYILIWYFLIIGDLRALAVNKGTFKLFY